MISTQGGTIQPLQRFCNGCNGGDSVVLTWEKVHTLMFKKVYKIVYTILVKNERDCLSLGKM